MQADSEEVKGLGKVEDEVTRAKDDSEYHPLFSSPDGDVVLKTKDGVQFRVHSYTLKTTSGWFRSMFSLPQASECSIPDVHFVDEDAHTLESILRMACGLPILRLDSFDVVDTLLFAIEKYDMPGPLSIIRMLVMLPPLIDEPFRLYAAATRFGWDVEAKFASTQTLAYNIHDELHRSALQRLNSESILDLFELHHCRREVLRQRLDDPPFVSGGTSRCVACSSVIDYHTWRELKYKIILEMDVRPLGDTVTNYGLLEWPEAIACWNAKCPNGGCDRALYDKGETLRVINDCVDALPKSI